MELSNRLIYNDALICGSEDVAMATMSVPRWEQCVVEQSSWLWHVINPSNSIVFIDTDKVSCVIVNL